MASQLHPSIQAFLAGFADTPLPPVSAMDAAAMRQIFDNPLPVEPVQIGESRDIQVPGAEGPLDARLYLPESAASERLTLFFHGGGFVMGTLDTHDSLCRHLCRELDSAVMSVAYRLAPEHPYPAAPEDCYAAVQWAAENRAVFAAADAQLLLAGDSAGACLCASVSLLARERGGADIDAQLLFYPTANIPGDSDSYRQLGGGEYFLSREMMEFYWRHYLGDSQAADGFATPLSCEDLGNLPQMHIVVAEFDPLRDEGNAYARRLEAAGNRVHVQQANGMIHGFMSMPGVDVEIREILQRIAKELA
ncbi:alpha/beta hydrolase [Microbulbifer taiwanensis]|uniref:Alpha/beta hydrolase n=1 Tax=Microbulbifer taiwanensis TaxID=986746 RepID=A0ABW1YP00_9GAMM|nr:alpha/beta hydrolase [Microbulbifer taiwanensis]